MKKPILTDIVKKMKENRLAYSIICLFWLACIVLLFYTSHGDAILFFLDYRSDILNKVMQVITTLGEEGVFIITILVFLFYDVNKSLWIIIMGLGLLVTIYMLKSYFGHPRPSLYFEHFSNEKFLISGWQVLSGNTSFPSGHTAAAFGFYTFISLLISRKGLAVFCVLIAILVGVSRIYLAQHFIVDVFAGSLYGFFLAFLAFYYYKRFYAERLGKSIVKVIKGRPASYHSSSRSD